MDEKTRLANENYPPLHPAWAGEQNEAFQHGFEVATEIERARSAKLVAALDRIGNCLIVDEHYYEVAKKALSDYKKGLE